MAVINMMTEKEFWDKFNKKHNPGHYYGKKKEETKDKKKNRRRYSKRQHSILKSKG